MFYVLGSTSLPRRRMDFDDYIAKGYHDLDIDWFDAEPFDVQIPNPLQIKMLPLNRDDPSHSDILPPYFEDCSNYFFRDDLLETLRACGVDNLDTYPVTIYDPDNGQTHSNYKAVNIIGAVAAADMDKSSYVLSDGIPLIDVAFDELVLRTDEIQDLLIFRLAENLITILVHESIRKVLIEKGFIEGKSRDAIEFYKLDEVGFI